MKFCRYCKDSNIVEIAIRDGVLVYLCLNCLNEFTDHINES